MHPSGKRVWLLLVFGLLAVPVTAAGIAYACTALATISTSSSSAMQGASVTVSGKGFAPHDPADIRTTPVEVHMDSASGPVLAQASPSGNNTGGTFSVDVTVPSVDPGDHVVIVTQNGIDGRPAYGTPARTVMAVTAPPAAAVAPPVVAAFVAAPPVAAMPTAPAAAVTKKKTKTMAQRIASCNSKYKVSKAKTKIGKRRVAARKASCVRAARSAA